MVYRVTVIPGAQSCDEGYLDRGSGSQRLLFLLALPSEATLDSDLSTVNKVCDQRLDFDLRLACQESNGLTVCVQLYVNERLKEAHSIQFAFSARLKY